MQKRKVFQPQPRKTCEGKNCYTHKHEAEAVKQENELLQPGLELDIYRCHLCGSWHLTQTKK